MTISLKSLALATAIALIPGAAAAQWYAGVDGGMNWTSDNDDLQNGFVGLISVGRDFGGPKLELEGGYRYNNGQRSTFTRNTGYGRTLSLMVNGIYEFLPQETWHPFIGAGIGFASVHTKANLSGLANTYASRTETLFAYQAMLGVAYDLNTSVAMRMQYRYFGTTDAEKLRVNGITLDTPQHNHAFLAGISYKFH